VISGSLPFEVVQSPENALRDTDALLGMVARAGRGSRVLVEQLYEHKYWGMTSSSPITDPNPRLEAYIAAARRGARWMFLMHLPDDPTDPRQHGDVLVNGSPQMKIQLACSLIIQPALLQQNGVGHANDRGWFTRQPNGSETPAKS
jgi:hypothetical protein